MKVWRVSHSSLNPVVQYYRTRGEATKVARGVKLKQMQARVKPADREPVILAEVSLPPLDAHLVVDMLNGRDPIIAVRDARARTRLT